MSEISDSKHTRKIKSYVLRTGRISTAQTKAYDKLGDKYLRPFQAEKADWNTFYPNPTPPAPLVLEIGFGMGEATAYIAALKPETNFIGCEVYPSGVGKLMMRLEEQNLTNVRIIQHDAVEVLEHMIQPESLDGVHIFFPDPWHKKRHNKRRLIQPAFIELLSTRVKSGGYIHCATDWQDYAEQILEVLSAESTLSNTSSRGYAEKPDYRPLTKFENRGQKLGHGVWDILFRKNKDL